MKKLNETQLKEIYLLVRYINVTPSLTKIIDKINTIPLPKEVNEKTINNYYKGCKNIIDKFIDLYNKDKYYLTYDEYSLLLELELLAYQRARGFLLYE